MKQILRLNPYFSSYIAYAKEKFIKMRSSSKSNQPLSSFWWKWIKRERACLSTTLDNETYRANNSN